MRSSSSARFSILVVVATLLALLSWHEPRAEGGGPALELACADCNDQNPCTVDSCDTATGFCRHDRLVCDDGNPCTVDSCQDYVGCRFVARPAGTACDDANPCSQGDACNGATPPVCTGSLLPAGTACDDANECTVAETCTLGGQCVGTAQTPGTACDDANACTSTDRCVESPAGSGNVVCGGTLQTCDDGDPCTLDACDPATGICGAGPRSCDDGNACTQDGCDPASGACLHTAVAGSCEDGVFCSVNDFCSAGHCRPGGPRNCGAFPGVCEIIYCSNDDRRCHSDYFDNLCPADTACKRWDCVLGNCAPVNLTGPCSDFNPCTTEQCSNGSCTVTGNLNGSPCDDGSLCTQNDTCNVSVCRGTPRCVDGIQCTSDFCDVHTGICHNDPVSGSSCNDGSPCTTGDICSNGQCVGTALCDDANPCTSDTCDPATLACSHGEMSAPCNDGDPCTGNDICSSGQCLGTALCDDANPCTSDTCDPATLACSHGNLSAPCNDGSPCTTGDVCFSGQCVGASLCDDANPCTSDTCDPATLACSHGELSAPCDDGDPCTTGDTCSGGQCHGSPGLAVTVSPAILSPADHELKNVHATVQSCGGAVSLVSIASNEPDDAPGGGDGRTTGDIQGAELGTADFDFQLRAELDKRGGGRIYTITYQLTAPGGESVTATAQVRVPKGRVRTIAPQPAAVPKQMPTSVDD